MYIYIHVLLCRIRKDTGWEGERMEQEQGREECMYLCRKHKGMAFEGKMWERLH